MQKGLNRGQVEGLRGVDVRAHATPSQAILPMRLYRAVDPTANPRSRPR